MLDPAVGLTRHVGGAKISSIFSHEMKVNTFTEKHYIGLVYESNDKIKINIEKSIVQSSSFGFTFRCPQLA